jgi:hypothetical protein
MTDENHDLEERLPADDDGEEDDAPGKPNPAEGDRAPAAGPAEKGDPAKPGAGAKPPPPGKPVPGLVQLATTGQKIFWAILLILSTIILGVVWFQNFEVLQKMLDVELTVSWEAPETVALKPGPTDFLFDRAAKTLRCKGPIDSKLKADLVALLAPDKDVPAIDQKLMASYSDAIGQLAYQSNAGSTGIFLTLLSLGGISGLLGVQLRSMVNFVGVACFKNELDIVRWWPWYFLRPLIGFFLGVLIVILVKAELFTASDKSATGSVWWVGIAFFAGFGASEFTDRLRLLAQTLFGKSTQ